MPSDRTSFPDLPSAYKINALPSNVQFRVLEPATGQTFMVDKTDVATFAGVPCKWDAQLNQLARVTAGDVVKIHRAGTDPAIVADLDAALQLIGTGLADAVMAWDRLK